MAWWQSFEISASGLTAERLRMDVIAGNIANAQTTRTADGGPYRRRAVVLAERAGADFATFLANRGGPGGRPENAASGGVRATAIAADPRPFKTKFDPSHPDADASGFVRLPNVDVVTEMVDLITASRGYEANVTALNAFKSMAERALQIGRS